MAKRKWALLSAFEQTTAVLNAIKRGRTIKQLADFFDAPPHDVERILVAEREHGAVRCSNKVWYRVDVPLVAPAPKPPRLTAKQELFLKRQGNLF